MCDTHSFVALTSLRIEGGGVVVEGFPVRAVLVPVEASADLLLLDVEVLGDAALNVLESGRVGGVL